MAVVDLRSDTVTRPGPEMRAAIAAAEVGDDVLERDPTVQRLEERCAALFGMAEALFVPSGTMANQLAIRCVCEPGDEIIIDETTHCYHYETGAPAALSGASLRVISGPRGRFTADAVRTATHGDSIHYARTRMVVVENTNNRGGGSVWPIEQIAAIRAAADDGGLHLHMDGARLMNACIALGCRPTDYTRHVDSVSVCFSKGLGAPVGSILAGSGELITRARRFRKMFGGAMRQSGLLAAGALYALDHHVERLADDHANARRFAEGIAPLVGIRLDPATVETNIATFEIEPRLGTAAEFVERLHARDVWMLPFGPQAVRAVTHLDVGPADIDQAIGVFREICR